MVLVLGRKRSNPGRSVEKFRCLGRIGCASYRQSSKREIQRVFTIEKLTILGSVSDSFKEKVEPMNPVFKAHTAGFSDPQRPDIIISTLSELLE